MSDQSHQSHPVDPEQACPWCGERNIDRLIWVEDDVVECHTCTCRYDPCKELVWREDLADLERRSEA